MSVELLMTQSAYRRIEGDGQTQTKSTNDKSRELLSSRNTDRKSRINEARSSPYESPPLESSNISTSGLSPRQHEKPQDQEDDEQKSRQRKAPRTAWSISAAGLSTTDEQQQVIHKQHQQQQPAPPQPDPRPRPSPVTLRPPFQAQRPTGASIQPHHQQRQDHHRHQQESDNDDQLTARPPHMQPLRLLPPPIITRQYHPTSNPQPFNNDFPSPIINPQRQPTSNPQSFNTLQPPNNNYDDDTPLTPRQINFPLYTHYNTHPAELADLYSPLDPPSGASDTPTSPVNKEPGKAKEGVSGMDDEFMDSMRQYQRLILDEQKRREVDLEEAQRKSGKKVRRDGERGKERRSRERRSGERERKAGEKHRNRDREGSG